MGRDSTHLGEEIPADLEEQEKQPEARDNGEAHEMLTWLPAKKFPYALNASKAPASRAPGRTKTRRRLDPTGVGKAPLA